MGNKAEGTGCQGALKLVAGYSPICSVKSQMNIAGRLVASLVLTTFSKPVRKGPVFSVSQQYSFAISPFLA